MTFQYHPDAAKELTISIQYYEDKSVGLGAEFLDEIEEAIAQALAHPKSGSLLTKQDRRILLDRFPYEIIYDISKTIITITAVKHLKRKPGYWESRK
ncbi:MAG: type II toxin-antitoxin system RelE/ParE family toxin [Gracilimonas sp.]|uniref:type II toxin-antitoxin system RelE/ParE family toxin n=1 Tax=Gracilimonas sp. TaxID=1974203 RepID=UPI001B0DFF8C|nr:type II toxin-antitoxin system RelE/ParE family toxin [Gracilimonas sp.]MBO6586149.1 type II toxin-antitoxin system RelE/ParE family toxin [Gracilimonas sp.]MBO6614806.1 type II toxin-antitoxin system RelE/ParE family toxin [Gracilimonas sp.]